MTRFHLTQTVPFVKRYLIEVCRNCVGKLFLEESEASNSAFPTYPFVWFDGVVASDVARTICAVYAIGDSTTKNGYPPRLERPSGFD